MTLAIKGLAYFVFLVLMLPLCTVQSAYAQGITFSVDYLGSNQTQTVTRGQPTRLDELLEATVFDETQATLISLYWPGSRLSSNKLQSQLLQQRIQLLADLNALASYWSQRGQVDIERSVKYLARELEQIKLKAGYKFALDPDLVRVRLQHNPILSRAEGTTFELRVPTNIEQLERWGLPSSDPHADTQWQWQIALNGDIKKNPVGLSNRHNNAWCFAHIDASPLQTLTAERCEPSEKFAIGTIFTGLSEQVLPGKWQSVNRRIAEIIKHRIK